MRFRTAALRARKMEPRCDRFDSLNSAVVRVPEALFDTLKGVLNAASNWEETYQALRSVVESGDILGNVSDAIKQSYIERIDNLEAEYERAGASGSFNAGRETGKLISDLAAAGTGVGGVIKGGALLVEKVTAKVVKVEVAGAKGGGSSGFSGGKPTIVDDPYSPNAVTERSSVNRDYYGRENAADEFSAGLPDYATHSTAKSYQSTAPRDLSEQTLWNRVTENPSAGRDTKLAGDKDFPRSEGWRKMEVSHRLPSGENITIHYQYNSVTDKAYDMKITTPQQLPPVLQPGRTIE